MATLCRLVEILEIIFLFMATLCRLVEILETIFVFMATLCRLVELLEIIFVFMATLHGWVHYSYLYQPDSIHYVLYYTSMNRDLVGP